MSLKGLLQPSRRRDREARPRCAGLAVSMNTYLPGIATFTQEKSML